MTDEQAIVYLESLKEYVDKIAYAPDMYGAIDKAIQALEQQPLHGYKIDFFSLGVTSWLSTFNTDSATECFTAVQELKRRLESKDED